MIAPRWLGRARRSVAAVAAGLAVLGLWKSLDPPTAAGLGASAVALMALGRSRMSRLVSGLFALAPVVIGSRMIEGRWVTAISILLIGVAILLHLFSAQTARIAAWFAAPVMAIATLGAIHQVYGFSFGAMAPLTTATLIALTISLLLTEPIARPIALLMTPTPAGVVARYLALGGSAGSMAITWIGMIGFERGLYGAGFLAALSVAGDLGLFTLLAVFAAASVERMDRERQQASEDARAKAKERAELLDRERDARLRADQESRINSKLRVLSASFASVHDHDQLVRLITDEAVALIGAETGAYFQYEATGPRLLYSVSGEDSEAITSLSRIGSDDIVRVDDVRADPRLAGLPIASYLGVPVISGGERRLGSLVLGHAQPGRFNEEHERLVAGLAAHAAIALDSARLYGALKESEERTQQANRRKDEFLAMLGHELRNPLSPILTALELMRLREDIDGRARAVIERQVRHLVRLVDDLLDVSRFTRGRIELKREPVETSQVISRAIEIASPLLEQRAHHLTMDFPSEGLVVNGDPVRLAQVIANLLTNAAKYTEPHGRIAVAAKRRDRQVVISVRDSGVGISPDLAPKMFDLFVQGEQTLDRAQGGLGIGLTIAKSLVELHGGTIRASSEGLGHGSQFELTLPLAVPRTPSKSAAVQRQRQKLAIHPMRVLVVDDNPDAADLLADYLEQRGHRTAVAHDGPQALEEATTFLPEIAVLDIGLPVMDGYELARRLRAVDGLDHIRLIALTGYGQQQDREAAREAGFDHHLVKPFDPDKLAPLLS